MSQRTDDDSGADDRILSDFSTDPELIGYSHKTWALAVLFVGLVVFVLPQALPLPVALVGGLVFVAGVGVLFSATPPHLTPWEFAHRRITYHTQQQIYVSDRIYTVQSKHTNHTKDNNE